MREVFRYGEGKVGQTSGQKAIDNAHHGRRRNIVNIDVQFVPEQVEGIPLHVTSSLVAELAPLSIFLESQFDPKLLIIEESESHLHVSKQLEVARLFFRLVNKGKAVWLTTHSDSFAQQVNNLVTLSRHPRKVQLLQELGYEPADTLKDVSYSSCYQFSSSSPLMEKPLSKRLNSVSTVTQFRHLTTFLKNY